MNYEIGKKCRESIIMYKTKQEIYDEMTLDQYYKINDHHIKIDMKKY